MTSAFYKQEQIYYTRMRQLDYESIAKDAAAYCAVVINRGLGSQVRSVAISDRLGIPPHSIYSDVTMCVQC